MILRGIFRVANRTVRRSASCKLVQAEARRTPGNPPRNAADGHMPQGYVRRGPIRVLQLRVKGPKSSGLHLIGWQEHNRLSRPLRR